MELVPSGCNKYDSCPRGIICRRAIYIQFPDIFWSILIREFLYTRAFYNEICQSLAFDSSSRMVSYFELSELDSPF